MKYKKVSKGLISLITLFAFLNLQGLALSQPNYQEKETGTLIIESEPPQAEIYIEGKFVGETPKTIKNILPGTYKVRIAKENHIDYVEEINIVAMQTVKIVARLEFTQDYKRYLEQKRLEQERQERLRKEAEERKRKRQEEISKQIKRRATTGPGLMWAGAIMAGTGLFVHNESESDKNKNIGIGLIIGGVILCTIGISISRNITLNIENAPVCTRITVGYRINF